MKISKLLFLLLFFLFAPAWGLADMSKEIHFNASDLSFLQQGKYVHIGLKNGERECRVGHPDLPFEVRTFIIPTGVKLESLEVVSLRSEELEGQYLLRPVKPDAKTDGSLFHEKENDDSSYDMNSFYPQELAHILNCGYLRGNHLLSLAIYPLQYFPSDGKMIFHSDVQLNLMFRPETDPSNPWLVMKKRDNTDILTSLISNQEDILSYSHVSALSKEATSPYSAEYVVITSQEMRDAFAPLVEWKTRKGVRAEIVTVDSIYNSYSGRDLPEKIRNFLMYAYQNGLKWLLLGGDEDIVPVRYAYQNNTSSPPPIISQQICDLYYADLTGAWDVDGDGVWGEPSEDAPDIYPEVFVGRIPCQSPLEASSFVEKLLKYEKDPQEGDFGYLGKALWLCSDQMRDWNQGEGQHMIVSRSLPDDFYQDLNSLIESPSGGAPSPSTPTGSDCIGLISQGWGITGILAHGRTDGFVASSNLINQWPKSYVLTSEAEGDGHGHLPFLSNQGKYGIVYSISCNQGALDYDKEPDLGGGPSVAETFILSPQKGAVAFLGYSRWGWVSASYKLAEKFIEELFDSVNDCHLGMAEALSKLYYPYYRDLAYGHNLFGDPEMQVWTKVPGLLEVTHPQILGADSQEVEFQVNSNGNPVAGARICITEDNQILFLGETDQQGSLNVQLDVNHCALLMVVVTKSNQIPYQGAIEVVSNTSAEERDDLIPARFELSQNHPNPFNPITQIDYQTSADGHVSLEVFNVLGHKVVTLADDSQVAGVHRVAWDGRGNDGKELSSGIYFYKLIAGQNTETRKMVFLK